MSIVVTGGTGPLGRGIVESLIRRGVAPAEIVTGGRKLENLKDLADQGVQVRTIDYDDPAGLKAVFEGAEKAVLVSGTDFGKRVQQHTNVAEAAKAAGVQLLVYTSAPSATTTKMLLAGEHKGTEEAIEAVGVPFAVLRNGWYFENYLAQIPGYQERGAIVGAAGDGRVSAAPRAEYAEAAAAVVAGDPAEHVGKRYELGGDTSFSMPELAAAVTEHGGVPVEYRAVTVEELEKILVDSGVPAPVAPVLADVDRAIADGELLIETGDLSRLIGRPTTTLESALSDVP